jgi:hypothetical protein
MTTVSAAEGKRLAMLTPTPFVADGCFDRYSRHGALEDLGVSVGQTDMRRPSPASFGTQFAGAIRVYPQVAAELAGDPA